MKTPEITTKEDNCSALSLNNEKEFELIKPNNSTTKQGIENVRNLMNEFRKNLKFIKKESNEEEKVLNEKDSNKNLKNENKLNDEMDKEISTTHL